MMQLTERQRTLVLQIDALLNRLAGDIVMAPAASSIGAARAGFAQLAKMLREFETPALDELIQFIESRLAGLDADLLAPVHQAVCQDWSTWYAQFAVDELEGDAAADAAESADAAASAASQPAKGGSEDLVAAVLAELAAQRAAGEAVVQTASLQAAADDAFEFPPFAPTSSVPVEPVAVTAQPVTAAPVAGPSSPAPRAADDEDLVVLASDPEMAAMFVAEALDHLGTIEATLLELETSPEDKRLLDDVFRPFHTIKGNAGALGVVSVQEFAHTVENLLDLARAGQIRMGPSEFDSVLKAVDVLTTMISELPGRVAGEPGTDTLRIRARLVAQINAVTSSGMAATVPASAETSTSGATGANPSAQVIDFAALEAAVTDDEPRAELRQRKSDGAGQTSVKVDTRKLDALVDMVGELVIAQALVYEDPAIRQIVDERLQRNLAQVRRITTDLQRNAMAMRLVPIKQTFQKMSRLVRDLSKRSRKRVELTLSGEDTELDRKVVEEINDPLMHMVRNSVDHGIEPADVRVKAGKRAEGRLSLSASHQGGSIVIAISDDGGGLNTQKILKKAVERGLVAPGEQLSPSDIHQLIFKPGFSTADEVTEISGRGVGMDVVRRNIEALRGRIDIQSTPGQGTTFLIKLPLTLAILDGLTLETGGQRFVLPIFSVRESLRPTEKQVHYVQGAPRMIQVREQLMPLMWLGDVFGIAGARADATQATVVVIEDDNRHVGLVVDELVGKQEVVIKSLGETFAGARGVAGGAILGDGRVGLIIDAGGLINLLNTSPARAA
jgi:two-component system chemotaxis sensor kinase CheA